MGNLLGYLESEFEQRREECAVIIEPTIPESYNGTVVDRKPDVLVIKDGTLVLLDLKAFEGEFTADCSPGGQWKGPNGESLLSSGRGNPFSQARSARVALMKHLAEHYVNKDNAPGWAKRKDGGIDEWVERSIKSWVVTWEGSVPTLVGVDSRGKPIDDRAHPYFKILPVDRVAGGLAYLHGEAPLMSTSELTRLISDLGAVPTNRLDWMRGALVLETTPPPGLTPRITEWMESRDETTISKALERIRELDLKSHLVHVVRCWSGRGSGSLRKASLVILIEWQYGKLGDVLGAALSDKDKRIVAFSLQFLTQNSYPETVPTLIQKLTEEGAGEKPTILKALAFSGSSLAGPAILSFAKNEFAKQPFKEFQHWADTAHELYTHDYRSRRAETEAFARRDEARLALISTFRASVEALGDLDFKPATPWLLEIVEHPTSVGFESDDFKNLELGDSDYYSVFDPACAALGVVGRGNPAVLKILLARLRTSSEDFQELIIRALGDLGDQAAAHSLLPFLDERNKHMSNVAIAALSKLRSPEAFEPLARLYFGDPHSDSARWTAEALTNIDSARFEMVLLKSIGDPGVSDDVREAHLRVLWPLATEVSADTLFSLLANPRFVGLVPWILGRLCQDGQNLRRALELASSKDPVEAGAAIETLTDYFVARLTDLDSYQSPDTPVEVRRAVVDVYYVAKSKESLTRFAKDPDESIRDSVFSSFRGGFYEDPCLVAGYSSGSLACQVGADQDGEYLAIQLPGEILLLQAGSIELLFFSTHGRSQGLYMRYRRASNISEDLLISVSVPWSPVPEEGSQFGNLLSVLKLSERAHQDSLSPKDAARVQELWERIDRSDSSR